MRASAGRRTPVMRDVAEAAGVSHQTVSRVLNQHPHVRAETRERVLAAIDRLGYRRNMFARALVTRASRTLGVVSFDTTLYGPASTVHGIEQAARASRYFISIVSLRTVDQAGVRAAVDYLSHQGVDGIVVLVPRRSAAEALADLPCAVPVVAVDGETNRTPAVRVDQIEGARLATAHLLELGHRTVWHVSGPADWLGAERRAGGWRRALADAGRETPAPLHGDWSPHSGYVAGKQLAARAGEVTAVFAANDQMALGVLRALTEAGVGVPEQISVVGFDDIPESAFFCPPLTTVRQDFGAVGRHSVDLLLRRIDDPAAAGEGHVVPATIVIRASSASPP